MTESPPPSGPLTPLFLVAPVRGASMLAEAVMEGVCVPVPSRGMLLKFHSGVMLDSHGRTSVYVLMGTRKSFPVFCSYLDFYFR